MTGTDGNGIGAVSPADLDIRPISTLGNGEAGQLSVSEAARRHSEAILEAYRAKPELIEEHANIERQQVEGGYGRRQLFELIQNGADELLGTPGRIAVVLTEDALYCANEGRSLSPAGDRRTSRLTRRARSEEWRSAGSGSGSNRSLGFRRRLRFSARPGRSGLIPMSPPVGSAK